MRSRLPLSALLLVLALPACRKAHAPEDAFQAANPLSVTAGEPRRPLPTLLPEGRLEPVALFDGAMPTGVTVSRNGRIFVSFPRWGDDVAFTVAEVKDGKTLPYPSAEINAQPGRGQLEKGFVSVQSVVVDPKDRLWALDTGSPRMAPTELGGPKLVAIDLATDAVVKTIVFPREVALATSYVNDVRFDPTRGKGGIAYITDSADKGPNGIIVVDLDSGKSWRKLHDHPSTKADPAFRPLVEGRTMQLGMGADGVAISGDGKTLFYCPLASRHLYAVPTDLLADPSASEAAVAKAVKDLGEKGASDGLESDAEGNVYLTAYEANAILRRRPDGTLETIAADTRALWPDTLSLAGDGYLYVTANQLHRQARFRGRDMRQRPYVLFRVKVDGSPVRLGG